LKRRGANKDSLLFKEGIFSHPPPFQGGSLQSLPSFSRRESSVTPLLFKEGIFSHSPPFQGGNLQSLPSFSRRGWGWLFANSYFKM